MYAGCIYGVHFLKPRYFLLQGIACNFMNELAKTGIFLGGPAYYGKSPDAIFSCIHFMYPHQWEIMLQAVITKMIAEGAFRFILARVYFSCYHKVCIRAYAITIFINIAESSSAKHARKGHFADPFRKRHYGRNTV